MVKKKETKKAVKKVAKKVKKKVAKKVLRQAPASAKTTADKQDDKKKDKKKPLVKTSKADLRFDIEDALDQMYDPEIPVSIWKLGLIYEINIDKDQNVHVVMTLTSPSCPVAGTLPRDVNRRVQALDGVNRARVEVTFEPAWTTDNMSEEAKFELGLL